jgi:N-acetylglucosamine-6-phosphate deacetylase
LLLGIEFKKGSLRPGGDADVLLLDQSLHVTDVWARGLPVH